MGGPRARVEVTARSRLRIEVPAVVAPAHQGGGDSHVVDQAAMRRDVADADADAAPVRLIRFGRVHDVGVVE
jgi:hypothetical protein